MRDDELKHYGTPRHSGRYPWGSGKDPYQHSDAFMRRVTKLEKKGLSKSEIAKQMGFTTTEFQAIRTNIRTQKKAEETAEWQRLRDKGWSDSAIAKRYGLKGESTVRMRLGTSKAKTRMTNVDNTAEMLRERLKENPFIDVGKGSHIYMNITESTLSNALDKLKRDGYAVQKVFIPQVTNPDKNTTVKVLTKEGVTVGEILANKDKIKMVTDYVTNDDGKSWLGMKKPESISSNRVMVRYAEDGGADKDGVIELRPGVEDISLGGLNYGQVRIAVDDTHYMKGMAMYAADTSKWPKGVDIVYNAHYTKDIPPLGPKDNTVLKPLKRNKETGEIDWSNPFGAMLKTEDGIVVGQREYKDENGETRLSKINLIRGQGDWNTWNKALSSQFLSKQLDTTIGKQLKLSLDVAKDQFDEINELTSPELKEKLLLSFADQCESQAVHLKAAALPRQSSKAILPVPSLKENEIFAPTYQNGEEVILVRHPHEGTFQIPTLIVNNKNKDALATIGNDAIDAVGIHPKAAQKMSGADFDGDTVIVIPTRGQKLSSRPAIEELKDFDPQVTYKAYEGMPRTGPEHGFNKQREMGEISNLISDMTLIGCDDKEIARAVKYSMTVIDAEKHNLDWKRSFEENRIVELREKYQGKARGGASTLISKAKGVEYIDDRKEKVFTKEYIDIDGKAKTKRYKFNPDTGEVEYEPTGKTMKRFVDMTTGQKVTYSIDPVTKERVWVTKNKYKDPVTGEKKPRPVNEDDVEYIDTDEPKRFKSTKMAEHKDAFELSSGTKKEALYAKYANSLKELAKKARVESTKVTKTKYNPSAAAMYADEVESLERKLNIALSNAPLERQAQFIATSRVEQKLKSNPEIKNDVDDLKKLRNQAINAAREEVGASHSKKLIKFEGKEWDALMSGAIRPTKIQSILNNANEDQVKKLATPHDSRRAISTSQINRIKSMSSKGATLEEIASAIGVSPSSIYRVLNE